MKTTILNTIFFLQKTASFSALNRFAKPQFPFKKQGLFLSPATRLSHIILAPFTIIHLMKSNNVIKQKSRASDDTSVLNREITGNKQPGRKSCFTSSFYNGFVSSISFFVNQVFQFVCSAHYIVCLIHAFAYNVYRFVFMFSVFENSVYFNVCCIRLFVCRIRFLDYAVTSFVNSIHCPVSVIQPFVKKANRFNRLNFHQLEFFIQLIGKNVMLFSGRAPPCRYAFVIH
jgi:hypothetical protein